MVTRNLLPLVIAFGVTALPAFAQDTATHNRQTELVKGTRITIEGCVAEGLKRDTYVLATVNELGGAPVETGKKRIYWLDSPKHVRKHVGHRVQIAGKIFDLERSEIEVDNDAGPSDTPVAKIEGPGQGEVQVPPSLIGVEQPRLVGALTGGVVQGPEKVDVPITLIKIKVDDVKVVTGSCGPAVATAVRPPR